MEKIKIDSPLKAYKYTWLLYQWMSRQPKHVTRTEWPGWEHIEKQGYSDCPCCELKSYNEGSCEKDCPMYDYWMKTTSVTYFPCTSSKNVYAYYYKHDPLAARRIAEAARYRYRKLKSLYPEKGFCYICDSSFERHDLLALDKKGLMVHAMCLSQPSIVYYS